MAFECIVCVLPVTPRQEGVLCEQCDRWQHVTCGTNISRRQYRQAILEGHIDWECGECRPARDDEPPVLLPVGDLPRRRRMYADPPVLPGDGRPGRTTPSLNYPRPFSTLTHGWTGRTTPSLNYPRPFSTLTHGWTGRTTPSLNYPRPFSTLTHDGRAARPLR